MIKSELFQFADNRVFIDIGEGCGNSCKYCYLDDAAEPQRVFDYETLSYGIQKVLESPKFEAGKSGTIISFCPHTEPFKSLHSAEALLFVIEKFAPYKNLMQLATKEIIPDFFIAGANKILDESQITVFISISSLNRQKYLEPLASNFHKRLENISKLRGSKVKGCIYLKPFLFEKTEFESLNRAIINVNPDAICIGIVYTYLENQSAETLNHPTEKNLLSNGINEKMLQFYDYIKRHTCIPIQFTSTCVLAQLNCMCNNVSIPQALCVNCNKECMKKKWHK